MRDTPFKVLFLCTANSARSILAEAILRREGGKRFEAYSAGSQPRGEVHPFALDLLAREGHDISKLRSKSWDEFADGDGESDLDFIFTVCDAAGAEVCPVWPGQPLSTHWGIPDPAALGENEAEQRLAFVQAYRTLSDRIKAMIALPDLSIDKQSLKRHFQDIATL